MAYMARERGPRTRGGVFVRFVSNVGARYTRRDSNIFSCLANHTQDGDADDDQIEFNDTENVEGSSEWMRRDKKRKFNSSSSAGEQLLFDGDDESDYSTMPTDEKLNLILSKVTLNENRFRRLEQMFDKVYGQGKKISQMSSVMCPTRRELGSSSINL